MKKHKINCPNCAGTGKVSKGVWYEETDNFLERFETCSICKGKGVISITNGGAK